MAKGGKHKKAKDKKAKRKKVKNPPKGMPQASPYLYYAEPRRAAEWLGKAFGLDLQTAVPGDDGELVHAELRLGKGLIMLGRASGEFGTRSPRDLPGLHQSVYLYVDDVDAHCELARAAGADIRSEPQDMFWGDRIYSARDCEGHHWSFAQHVKDVEYGEAGPG